MSIYGCTHTFLVSKTAADVQNVHSFFDQLLNFDQVGFGGINVIFEILSQIYLSSIVHIYIYI